jgi:RNA polymerase sigma factor (sigma-70 family)
MTRDMCTLRASARSPEQPESAPASTRVLLAFAASHGDTLAMNDLMRDLHPRVRRVVCAVLGPSHRDIDDVTQLAMLGIVRSIRLFRGECEPVDFARRIAARTAIANARQRRNTDARYADDVELDHFASLSPEPDANAERSHRLAVLREALTRIPEEQAETLTLRVVLGWTLPEVAKATGAPLNTVRSRIRLAKNALRVVIDRDPAMRVELG